MTKTELQQKYSLGQHAALLNDIAAFLREGSPFVAQLGVVMDETNAVRQLGKHEGWGAACQIIQTLHETPKAPNLQPVAPYSEPQRTVQPEEKK